MQLPIYYHRSGQFISIPMYREEFAPRHPIPFPLFKNTSDPTKAKTIPDPTPENVPHLTQANSHSRNESKNEETTLSTHSRCCLAFAVAICPPIHFQSALHACSDASTLFQHTPSSASTVSEKSWIFHQSIRRFGRPLLQVYDNTTPPKKKDIKTQSQPNNDVPQKIGNPHSPPPFNNTTDENLAVDTRKHTPP